MDTRLDLMFGPRDEDDDPPFPMACATIVYLAYRRDEIDADAIELLRLAAQGESMDIRPREWQPGSSSMVSPSNPSTRLLLSASRRPPQGAAPARFPAVHPDCLNTPRRDENGFEELCHLVTEADPDTALCGRDVTGYPWNPPWPHCEACLAVSRGEMN